MRGTVLIDDFGPCPSTDFAEPSFEGVCGADCLARGAIVCTAVLSDCLRTDRQSDLSPRVNRLETVVGNWWPGRIAWRLDDVRALEAPIPFKGRQGLFDVPDDLFRRAA